MTENTQPVATTPKDNLPTAGRDEDLFSFSWTEDGSLLVTQKGEDAMALTFGSSSETINTSLMAQCLSVLGKHECVAVGIKEGCGADHAFDCHGVTVKGDAFGL